MSALALAAIFAKSLNPRFVRICCPKSLRAADDCDRRRNYTVGYRLEISHESLAVHSGGLNAQFASICHYAIHAPKDAPYLYGTPSLYMPWKIQRQLTYLYLTEP